MVRKRGDRCSIEGCGRKVHCVGLCLPCYSRVRYWIKKRSVRKVMSRVHDLQIWQASLETLLGGKVTTIRRRRRRKAA